MSARPAILLIHGGCHGSWCWEYLTPQLEARGYEVNTIDLPGRAPSVAWGWSIRLKDQVKAIVAKAAAINRPTIALAHSMGGISMSAAAELEPALFTRLVYVSAYIPTDGERLVTLGARDKMSRVGQGVRNAMLKGFVSVRPEMSASILYGDCSAEQIAWANARVVKEPLRPALDKVNLTNRFAAVPRSYVRCTQDQAITEGFQDEMIAASPCSKVATLASSHSPFLSMPARLADAIVAVT